MDVPPIPITNIGYNRDAQKRRQRRKNRPRKEEDHRSQADTQREDADEGSRLDLIA